MKFAQSIRPHYTNRLDVYDMAVETIDKNGEKLLFSPEEYEMLKIALKKAAEAYDKAGKAYEKVEKAYEKAEEAYEKAEEAHAKAGKAYAKADLLEDNASLSHPKVLPKDLENYFLIVDGNRRFFVKKSEFFEKYEFKDKITDLAEYINYDKEKNIAKHISYDFWDYVKKRIVSPHHHIVACNKGAKSNAIMIARHNIDDVEARERYEQVLKIKIPTSDECYIKEIRSNYWSVLNKCRTGIGFYEGEEDVNGKDVILVDDIIGSGESLINAVEFLHSKGAKSIMACVTHGRFTGDSFNKIITCEHLGELYVSDSLPQCLVVSDAKKITIINIVANSILASNEVIMDGEIYGKSN